MNVNEKSKIVGDMAEEVFKGIKNIRKTFPNRTRAQRNAIESEIKSLKDNWFAEILPLLKATK